jgi:hypothetical protein
LDQYKARENFDIGGIDPKRGLTTPAIAALKGQTNYSSTTVPLPASSPRETAVPSGLLQQGECIAKTALILFDFFWTAKLKSTGRRQLMGTIRH